MACPACNTAHPPDGRRSSIPSDANTSASSEKERPPLSPSDSSTSSRTAVNSPSDEPAAVGIFTGAPLSDEPEVEKLEPHSELTSGPDLEVDHEPSIYLCTATMSFFTEGRYRRDKLSVCLTYNYVSKVTLTAWATRDKVKERYAVIPPFNDIPSRLVKELDFI